MKPIFHVFLIITVFFAGCKDDKLVAIVDDEVPVTELEQIAIAPYIKAPEPDCLCKIGITATMEVFSSQSLFNALSSAVPGTTIVVKSDTYHGDFILVKSGSSTDPITIRSEEDALFIDNVFLFIGRQIFLF